MPDEVAGHDAAGEYRYLLNGEATAITETWTRQALPGGQHRITSRRSAPGVEITVDAVLGRGLVTSCVITWQSDGTSVQADYVWRENTLDCLRLLDGSPVNEQQVACEQGDLLLLFPLMRIFTGPLITRLLDNGGTGQVVVPDIRHVNDSDGLLRPLLSQRKAHLLEEGVALDIDGETMPCRLCEYTGEQYGSGSKFWVGECETLLRYQWQQGPGQHWDVWLEPERV